MWNTHIIELIILFWFILPPQHNSLHFTCVAGSSSVPWLTVADGLSSLWQTTFPVSAALPPAGRRLLLSITVLTLVAFAALAAVGLTFRHTLTMSTSRERGRTEGRQVRGDVGADERFTSDYFMTVIAEWFVTIDFLQLWIRRKVQPIKLGFCVDDHRFWTEVYDKCLNIITSLIHYQ